MVVVVVVVVVVALVVVVVDPPEVVVVAEVVVHVVTLYRRYPLNCSDMFAACPRARFWAVQFAVVDTFTVIWAMSTQLALGATVPPGGVTANPLLVLFHPLHDQPLSGLHAVPEAGVMSQPELLNWFK